ncbi:hypothetical protein LOAG_02280 [Loa loa]|uniref:Uncharacterized protein n=1 Tax=Loa loa TaxID=7209 RepID=A0A1S0U7A0_LOALO|nr:hypothetical protein LOAG_02280 [Loa loa]EFO26208.1 hypothetical protein LOAG_02280 [Loa loa]
MRIANDFTQGYTFWVYVQVKGAGILRRGVYDEVLGDFLVPMFNSSLLIAIRKDSCLDRYLCIVLPLASDETGNNFELLLIILSWSAMHWSKLFLLHTTIF